MSPDYIKEPCVSATVTERRAILRSTVFNTGILTLPTRSTNTKFGDRAAGPTAWNTLPVRIRQSASLKSFTRQLKTSICQVFSADVKCL